MLQVVMGTIMTILEISVEATHKTERPHDQATPLLHVHSRTLCLSAYNVFFIINCFTRSRGFNSLLLCVPPPPQIKINSLKIRKYGRKYYF